MVEIRYSGSHYYLIVDYRSTAYSQSEYLKMEYKNYIGNLYRFNGFNYADDMYFKDYDDAEKAREWIESAMIMNQLAVSNEDS